MYILGHDQTIHVFTSDHDNAIHMYTSDHDQAIHVCKTGHATLFTCIYQITITLRACVHPYPDPAIHMRISD